MNKLVSKNRSTQFARHELSEREKLFPGVPVTHLHGMVRIQRPTRLIAQDSLIPANVRKLVNRSVKTRLSLFVFNEGREFLLLNKIFACTRVLSIFGLHTLVASSN